MRSLIKGLRLLRLYVKGYSKRRRFRQEVLTFPFYQRPENLEKLDEFIVHLQDTQLPYEQIEHIPDTRWSSDTWTFETSLCLRAPLKYNTPLAKKYGWNQHRYHRYVHNFLDVLRIYESTYCKLWMHKHLCEVANMSDNLLICEIGRGLDLIVALTVKNWKLIQCYDGVDLNRKPLMGYFSRHNLDYSHADSRYFDFSAVGDRTIVIANQHNIPLEGIEEVRNNNRIVCAIVDGEILKTIKG